MKYRVKGIEVFISFETEAEASAYAAGKLEAWFRFNRQEAPDSISCRKATVGKVGRYPVSLCIAAKLGNEKLKCYTVAVVEGFYLVISPDIDDYSGVKKW